MDTCPNCQCESYDHEYLGSYNVRCADCGHEWNLRVLLGLSPDSCECCGNRLSWGCGHTYDQESDAVQHRKTVEHYNGECEGCFTPAPGFIPPKVPSTLYPTHAEWVAYLTRPSGQGVA